MPYWPQFVRRSHLEDMTIQFSQGLPLLELRGKTLGISRQDMERELVLFYERFLADDVESFAIDPERAPGLYELTRLICEQPKGSGLFIKGQTVGPVTFAAGVRDEEGRYLFYYPDLVDAYTKGLAIRALWQVRHLAKTGKRPVIFLDEPYLTGFGSAFAPVRRDDVVALIREVIDYLKQRSDALVGIHCCGNTDWPMLVETQPDVISFDAYSSMEYFLLFPEAISSFIRRGGVIAWGIVPTFQSTGKETVEGLYARLQEGLRQLYRWHLDPEEVAGQSLLTPACGMATLDPVTAGRVTEMLLRLSRMCREKSVTSEQ